MSPTRNRRWRTSKSSSRPATYVTWSGQFEYLERAEARLKIVVPVTLLIIFLLLYLNFRR
jgi:Cu(I)/Ag(I) efflux system membrane protein CusA/SilA